MSPRGKKYVAKFGEGYVDGESALFGMGMQFCNDFYYSQRRRARKHSRTNAILCEDLLVWSMAPIDVGEEIFIDYKCTTSLVDFAF